MPRSNRPRRDKDTNESIDFSHVLAGRLHVEEKRDGLWNVQPIAAASATKYYTCPGCGLEVLPGAAHTVAWRADGLMGAEDDLAGRRHWHNHCWAIHR